MESNEFLPVKGTPTLVLTDENGTIKHVLDLTNLVTSAGKTYFAQRVLNLTPATISQIAIGTGTSPTTPATTSMSNEVGTRINVQSQTVGGAGNNEITVTGSFGQNNPVSNTNISEVGLFSSSGALLARATFTPFTKLTTDFLTCIWKIRIG